MANTTVVNPMQAKYEQALERAQADHLVIFHADPAVGEWFVQNPSHDGFYTVRQETPKSPFTCNCPATDYCKHRAFVRCHVVNKWALPRLYGRKLAEALAMAARGMSLAPAPQTDPEPPTPTAPAPTPAPASYDDPIFTCRGCGNLFTADDIVLEGSLLNPIIRCKPCHAAWKASLKSAKAADTAAKAQPKPPTSLAHDGTYTIVHTDGTHRTLKVHTPREGGLAGKHIIKYLCGSDNTSDYAGFAFFGEDGAVHMWKRFADNADLLMDACVLAQPEQAQAAGLAYALESGACYHCGRTLTVPASIHRGLGPDCAKLIGA